MECDTFEVVLNLVDWDLELVECPGIIEGTYRR